MAFSWSHPGLGRQADRQSHWRRAWTSASQVVRERESERWSKAGIGPFRVFKTNGTSELEYSWSWSVNNGKKTMYEWSFEKEDAPANRPEHADQQDLLIQLSLYIVETGYRAGIFRNQRRDEEQEQEEDQIYEIRREARQLIRCDQLVTEGEGVSVLSPICSHIDVPVEDIPGDILYEIISFGRIVSSRRGSGRCIPPTIPRICFTLRVCTWLKEEDEMVSIFKSRKDRVDRALLNPSPAADGELLNPNPMAPPPPPTTTRITTTCAEKVIYMQRCSICLDDFPHGSILARLSCGHIFHQRCILPSHHSSCPLCVSSLVLSTLPTHILHYPIP